MRCFAPWAALCRDLLTVTFYGNISYGQDPTRRIDFENQPSGIQQP